MVTNAAKSSNGLDLAHVACMSLSRVAIPLYFFVWPDNLLSLLLRSELRPVPLSACFAFGGRHCLPPPATLASAAARDEAMAAAAGGLDFR
jgi:hypothetical protein